MSDSENYNNSDTTLARVLLDGFVTENNLGVPRQVYLSDKTVAADPFYDGYEDECRQALARLLRAGAVPPDLLDKLASLFAPDEDPEAADRRLNFGFRGRGGKSDHIKASFVVQKVASHKHDLGTADAAIVKVAEDLAMTYENVKGYWKAAKPFRDAGVIE